MITIQSTVVTHWIIRGIFSLNIWDITIPIFAELRQNLMLMMTLMEVFYLLASFLENILMVVVMKGLCSGTTKTLPTSQVLVLVGFWWLWQVWSCLGLISAQLTLAEQGDPFRWNSLHDNFSLSRSKFSLFFLLKKSKFLKQHFLLVGQLHSSCHYNKRSCNARLWQRRKNWTKTKASLSRNIQVH